jgi:hypothetical protein
VTGWRKLASRPGFWVLVQWIPWLLVIVAAWPLPTWRYLLAVFAAFAYGWTESGYWKAKRGDFGARDV